MIKHSAVTWAFQVVQVYGKALYASIEDERVRGQVSKSKSELGGLVNWW